LKLTGFQIYADVNAFVGHGLLLNYADENCVKIWENERSGETRTCLWFEDAEYFVVLANRKGYILLWTAYPISRKHEKAKKRQEYENYLRKNS
jgi:hypothetical protein